MDLYMPLLKWIGMLLMKGSPLIIIKDDFNAQGRQIKGLHWNMSKQQGL